MIRNFIDILIAKLAIWSIKKGYGICDKESDTCPACKATKVIDWLEDHIKLIK